MKPPVPPAGAPAYVPSLLAGIVQWVTAIRRGPGARIPYLTANLPNAAEWNGTTLPVSDGTGGMPTVTAIGGQWVYPDGTTV